MLRLNSPDLVANEQREVEERSPSNLEAPEAQPSTSINGTVTSPASIKQVPITNAYTSMVDPEEGTDLKFIPAHTTNGVRCAKLEKEDVADEIEY